MIKYIMEFLDPLHVVFTFFWCLVGGFGMIL